MKRLLTLLAFFATLHASAQQVNPVPDYVFRNQMSVGRGTVTDTAAYFSIGPRYGATKGFMPPIVGDTATFSSGKRNGLLIFSVQKNKFLYWDSVRVQWSDMAGGSGSYILAGDTSAMLAPYLRKADTTSMLTAYLRKGDTSSMLGNYIRHAGYGLTKSGQSFLVDTLNIATRAWRQKGIDSVVSIIPAAGVGGSGTTNYVAKFTAGSTIGNSSIVDNGTGVGVGISPTANTKLYIRTNTATDAAIYSDNGTNTGFIVKYGSEPITNIGNDFNRPLGFLTNNTERLRIFANGRVFIGASPTDAGYQLDINGTLRSVNGANFATTSGNVGVGTASPGELLSLKGSNAAIKIEGATNNYLLQIVDANNRFRVFDNSASLERLTILSSGNVGIGTASPLSKLHAFGAGGSTAVKLTLSNGGDVNALNDPMGVIDFYSDDASGGLQGTKGYLGVYNEFNGNWDGSGSRYDTYMAFGTSLDNSLSEKMRIKSDAELLINTTTDAGDYKLQVSGNIYNTGTAVLAATSGNVGIGTASPAYKFHTLTSDATIAAFRNSGAANGQILIGNTAGDLSIRTLSTGDSYIFSDAGKYLDFGSNASFRMRLTSDGELLVSTTSDAGDYKLQVVGNARIGTGKLDIASNTTFGLGVARSGTSEVAGQIYNSNGILYLGAESSAGGQIFSGSSAYAAVIGSGANYPLQFATNNATRATIDTDGDLGIATTAPTEKLDVNGRARIRTIDSTSTAINLLYADVDGVIKKAPVSASGISGSGTTNYIPKFTSGSALGNSILYENNSELFINTTSDQGDYKLQVNGSIYNTGQVTRGVINVQGTGAQIFVDSTTNLVPFSAIQSLSGSNASALLSGNVTWNTTGNPSAIDVFVTNTASGSNANYINVGDGTNIFKVTKDAGIITGNPSGGTAAKWKLGSKVDTEVALDASKYIEVEIGGVYYRLAVVTPL